MKQIRNLIILAASILGFYTFDCTVLELDIVDLKAKIQKYCTQSANGQFEHSQIFSVSEIHMIAFFPPRN